MYNLKVESDLNLPHQQQNANLNKLIKVSLRKKHALFEESLAAEHCWHAEQFLLNKSKFYKKTSSTIQSDILTACNEMLMSDFYFLEKSGLAYCAKMILLAETTEIRQLYGLIAADEAIHLSWFTPYVKEERRINPQGKLLPVLGKIIEDCDANTLYYLVQTLIEGWGFVTYKALVATCQDPTLKIILKKVLRDEALHHKVGPTLFSLAKINTATNQFIYEKMQAYTEVLRVGPQTIVQCIEQVVGELDLATLEKLFSDLKTEFISNIKLKLFSRLMSQPGMEHHVVRLKEQGYLTPYSAANCAKIYRQTRGTFNFI